jgi:hypothetical protein
MADEIDFILVFDPAHPDDFPLLRASQSSQWDET